jgi:ornithine decarboxylase
VLSLGVDPSRIIYAQPCKTKSYIRHASATNVRQMTFDNADELYKIQALFPDAELYLRILTDDSSSLCQLSLKFGAALSDTADLLSLAKDLGLNVVGVSFHVGSGASDPVAFQRAVEDARTVFDQAAAVGYSLHTLDVGGGFTSDLFESMAGVLSDALDALFPPSIRIIGEPGRYFVARAYTLACSVIARRQVSGALAKNLPQYMLYLNDGVYGNFSSIIFDHQEPVPHVLRAAGEQPRGKPHGRPFATASTNPIEYSLWGPTCDGIDCIAARCELPCVLDVGDWLYFPDMGAYTRCSATKFNGFEDHHRVIYVCSEPGARALMN